MASATIHDQSQKSDRRQGPPRVPIQLPVEIFRSGTLEADEFFEDDEDGAAGDTALNVSTGGMFIRTARYLKPGTKVKVGFNLFGLDRVEAEARVVWASEGVVGNTARFARGIGIEFVVLPPTAKEKILQLTLEYHKLP